MVRPLASLSAVGRRDISVCSLPNLWLALVMRQCLPLVFLMRVAASAVRYGSGHVPASVAHPLRPVEILHRGQLLRGQAGAPFHRCRLVVVDNGERCLASGDLLYLVHERMQRYLERPMKGWSCDICGRAWNRFHLVGHGVGFFTWFSRYYSSEMWRWAAQGRPCQLQLHEGLVDGPSANCVSRPVA